MRLQVRSQDPLKEALSAGRLFGDWLTGELNADFISANHSDAQVELETALSRGAAVAGPSPLFQSEWVRPWSKSLMTDLPDDESRTLFRSQVATLRNGEAEVVVTGQQPGVLGGPLYTLYKVATAISLAKMRTDAGRPTIPVFWSGDDDDDLSEALSPVTWDPGSSQFLSQAGPPVIHGNAERPSLLGRRKGEPWFSSSARWLNSLASVGGTTLANDLAAIWQEAVADQWPWSRLARKALLRTFAGHGLIVVSGDDPGLHAAAAPLYEKIRGSMDSLVDLAASRGGALEAAGWHAQINGRSLARSLFRVEADHRIPMEGDGDNCDPQDLRPGVMLRSPIQDWLLRPAAVVAGPGELAYLRQLDPLYKKLDVVRPPLVPRLFAWLLPAGFDAVRLLEFRQHMGSDPQLADRLADEAETNAREFLVQTLKDQLGLDDRRADSLASGRARRWRKGVGAMFRDEIERNRLASRPSQPEWVFPNGQRQERHLTYGSAAAWWGSDLISACLTAAEQHLEMGRHRDWREFLIEVPDPR